MLSTPSHVRRWIPGNGIFPFLIGIFVILKHCSNWTRLAVAFVMASDGLIVMLPLSPGWDCRFIPPCVTADVGGNELKVDLPIAGVLTTLKNVAGQYAPNGRSFVVTPLWSGAYAFLRRKSPMWDAPFPRGTEFQQREIERIKASHPGFESVLDVALDGRDDLRYRNSHPLIEQFIRDNFDPITVGDCPRQVYQFYKSR
jgi:hypothetical protein